MLDNDLTLLSFESNKYFDLDNNFIKQEYTLQYNLQFFAKEGPGGEKTEAPTAKRLEKAREEGQVARSREISNAAGLITLFVVLKFFISILGDRMVGTFTSTFTKIPDIVATDRKGLSLVTVSDVFVDSIVQMLIMCAPFFAAGFVIAFLVMAVQVKFKVSLEPMKPKLNKLNPANGIKRMFSKQVLFDLLLSIVKIGLIFYIAYMCLKDHANELFILYDMSLYQAIALIGEIIIDTGLRISLVYIIIGIADYIFQKRKFNEDMKMTKKEIQDEYKDSEGDPQIKGKQKQRMREASMRRMMQDVPKADVVITNPTHYAVALQYEMGESGAPRVVAKGQDFVALRIKEVAKDNKVPIVEDPRVARNLYATCEIGEEIPAQMFEAVALILSHLEKYRP